MSLARFQFLLELCRFDDKTTREERKKKDKFAAFRGIWDKFVDNCSRYFSPTHYVTIDETLFGFRGRCPFKMYLPSKPDKYGMKVISLVDAKFFYFCGGIPYVGKEITKKKGDLCVPTQYVLKLIEQLNGSGRNITADNWFSSIEVVAELQKKRLTFVGTMRKNKPQIPPSFLAQAPVSTSRFAYQDDKMMVAYSPKKNKEVVLVSSMHYDGVVNDDSKLPEIIEFYNVTKGGVDVLDKLCHPYTTKRKTNRWPMRYFCAVLDIAAVNSSVLHKWNVDKEPYPSTLRSTFLKSLAIDLATTWMEKRFSNQHLPRSLRMIIGEQLGKQMDTPAASSIDRRTKKKRRCDSYTKDRKGNSYCSKCGNSLCGEHKVMVCPGYSARSDEIEL
ncbi:piggyBac transposable element-derived protein 4-like [Belonocnema kinseyi]|uniref:piggyBac transposable element-derived protein 4-like n=1 Tax=Belonocnema kinseyi TaxID=2817044 RepID=UPI00143CD9FB|nr:piggyBac transposable element-derived protein 4-like [Belonocnema kinseyi]